MIWPLSIAYPPESSPKSSRFSSCCETGLLARALHDQLSPGRSFETVNCAACPGQSLKAELFGSPGRFGRAAGGTLLLQKVEKAGEAAQVEILRRFSRGGRLPRLFSASLADPQDLGKTGGLLPEFMRLISGVSLILGPLRERRCDIMPLLAYFSGGRRSALSPGAEKFIMNYDWPGNVHEVKRLAEMLSCSGKAAGPISEATVELYLNSRFF